MITVSHLTKYFGETCAVNDLSFTIKPGEVVGLLGPNGAGKTTTMRMLTGFMSPDRGTVSIDTIDITQNPILAQEKIGYLPENNPLYKDMLVGELLEYSLSLRRILKQKHTQVLDFAVKSVSIADVYYHPITELSKGYKQRVGIALAILHQPEILVMDEPSEGLDPNQRSEIRTLIRKLSKNHTILLSTHVMQEVEAVCERMIIMNRGSLVADGTPKTLLKKVSGSPRLMVEIEGAGVESTLKNLPGVKYADVKKLKNGKFSVYLTPLRGVKLPPILSKLAAQKKWVIWKLTEEEKHLEDLFRQLTHYEE